MGTLRNVAWFFKKNKKYYVIGISALIMCYFFIPIPTFFIGKIVDGLREQTLTKDILFTYTAIIFGSMVLLYIVEFTWHYHIFGNSFKFGRDNRRRLVQKLMSQNPEFYYKNSTGSLMSKATHDVGNLQMLAGYGILALFDAIVYPISLILIMGFTISWKLTFFSILALPLMIVFSAKLGKVLDEKFTRIQKSMEELNESVLENVNSIRVIKGFSTQKITEKRFDEDATDLYNKLMDQNKLSALFFPIGRIIPAITFVVALLVGEKMMGQSTLTLGQMVSFFMYLNMLTWPMFAFGDLINVWHESSSSVRRLQEVYEYKEDFVEKENLQEYKGARDIEFKHFTFTYPGANMKSLDDINLKISNGETLGIVGKIGSGKTTLVKQLLRLYNVKEDSLYIGGKSVEDYTRASIRDKIGYVPQQHILFSKSVFDNIAFGGKGADAKLVDQAVEFADFTKDLHTLPEGLETTIGERGVSISGGQKQRISISRAIIKDPEILILDDSLSAVDSLTEKNIITNIKNERVGKTTIIVAHRLSGVKHADNIVVLEDGKIIEQGNHEQLLANKGWYYTQYESQRLGGSNGKE
ncbi:MAG: ABC transporter ATP-binding protein [Tissierellia bacterium]|nr:ABC transporter ATP-binding protein [Tissierellia bacterium]